jgi:hypothetical protein
VLRWTTAGPLLPPGHSPEFANRQTLAQLLDAAAASESVSASQSVPGPEISDRLSAGPKPTRRSVGPMVVVSAILQASGLVLVAVVVGVTRTLAGRQELPRNGALGLRTSATKASAAAWQAGHDAAAGLLGFTIAGSLLGAVAIVTAGVWALANGASTRSILIVSALAYVAATGSLLLATAKANRAARDISPD